MHIPELLFHNIGMMGSFKGGKLKKERRNKLVNRMTDTKINIFQQDDLAAVGSFYPSRNTCKRIKGKVMGEKSGECKLPGGYFAAADGGIK